MKSVDFEWEIVYNIYSKHLIIAFAVLGMNSQLKGVCFFIVFCINLRTNEYNLHNKSKTIFALLDIFFVAQKFGCVILLHFQAQDGQSLHFQRNLVEENAYC